ncbi:DUF5348 domain-containing protein [Lentibacillus salicampi]|uniref:DUF5348 domain-containing protein n=1 Tax=Lentibacillus salicampi TaxID=175306 RepID=A0A4Y9A9Y8_9BACI|nr:DUF5348 domain-containing protein [Lentibacillus salicampi]TFJ90633.1 hypothetical protein E4U82_19260 [Lentibacillus salicampi]
MKTTMIYNPDLECWMVELRGRSYPLHCGECFELLLGRDKLPCRLELDNDWYVIMEEMRFNLREQDSYKVII